MINILATADACKDYALANMLSLIQTAFTIICVITPILLMISIVITIISVVTDPDQKHTIKKIVSKIIAALIIFFLPTIVNFVMNILPDGGINITSCWQAAREKNAEISMIERVVK